MKRFAYVGCRTTRERSACGNGIEVYQVNDVTGSWIHVGTVKTLENPSYLSFDKEKQYLYAVHGDTTKASAFKLEPETGMPVYINSIELGGSNPVFLLPDHTNREMLIACLGSGSIMAVRREEDGGLGTVDARYVFPGNEDAQKMTCPHQIYYDMDERYLIVSLKGIKKTTIPAYEGLAVFHFSPESGFHKIQSIGGRNFDHCRQVTVHPDNRFVYLLNELQSRIISLYLDGATGRMAPFQVTQTLPDTCVDTGALLAGTLCCTKDGRYLYVSNRGHDSLAMFSVEQETGRLTNIGWIPSMGRHPRFICLDPTSRYLYAANEKSHTIIQYRVEENGLLTCTNNIIETGSPVCIIFGS